MALSPRVHRFARRRRQGLAALARHIGTWSPRGTWSSPRYRIDLTERVAHCVKEKLIMDLIRLVLAGPAHHLTVYPLKHLPKVLHLYLDHALLVGEVQHLVFAFEVDLMLAANF
eukprot:CAMPEP_0182577308 /NCGR_PEP_ID=MMETSP1324-20130603/37153_1 /TAXON_ID=236786 /ORGANISM="Florenciella sp., Strain RCC1587" /LENGTH=113 /DNA_ID=CAMNT_0024793117 /DNA_START=40 /DNA_END=381 /DNA_ORIENTATION=-